MSPMALPPALTKKGCGDAFVGFGGDEVREIMRPYILIVVAKVRCEGIV